MSNNLMKPETNDNHSNLIKDKNESLNNKKLINDENSTPTLLLKQIEINDSIINNNNNNKQQLQSTIINVNNKSNNFHSISVNSDLYSTKNKLINESEAQTKNLFFNTSSSSSINSSDNESNNLILNTKLNNYKRMIEKKQNDDEDFVLNTIYYDKILNDLEQRSCINTFNSINTIKTPLKNDNIRPITIYINNYNKVNFFLYKI